MKFEYMITDNTDPYMNLATEQALFELCGEETAILYLWQNDNTIVVGRNQDVLCECKAEQFIADGGRIARRRSGGGAVYHDLGNLNFSLICREKYKSSVSYQNIISSAMERLGLKTEYNGRNDILIDKRKFSGNAVFSDGMVCCQHGTIMVSCDIEKMERYLTPDKGKMERNSVRSVSSRVMNLTEAKPDLTVPKVISAFVESVGAHEMNIRPSDVTVECLYKIYSDKKWILGGTI